MHYDEAVKEYSTSSIDPRGFVGKRRKRRALYHHTDLVYDLTLPRVHGGRHLRLVWVKKLRVYIARTC